ncbi:MAG: tyrosine-type recombinase/integrase [Acidobacteriota bacterium]
MEKRYFSVKETAQYLGFSPGAVYNLISQGKIPATKIGNTVRINKEELDKFLKENTRPVNFVWNSTNSHVIIPQSEMRRGDMGIKKIKNIYWIDKRFGDYRLRKSLKTSNKKTAFKLAQQEEEKAINEIYGLTKTIKLADFFQEYKKLNHHKKYIVREEQRLNLILKFFGENIFLHEITPQKLEELKIYLKENGRSEATVNRYISFLRLLFNHAINWNYIRWNPVKRVRFYKEQTHKRKALNKTEIQILLSEAKEISDRGRSEQQKYLFSICVIALSTGMRINEILNLKWKDIDLDLDKIIVPSENSKTKESREIPMNSDVRKIITLIKPQGDYIFQFKGRRHPDSFRRQIIKLRKAIGEHFRGFHNLRHSFATFLVQNKIDSITIAKLLGHSHLKTTFNYSHTFPEAMKKAVEGVNLWADFGHMNEGFFKEVN